MTEEQWSDVLTRFEDHERRFREMAPAEPMPAAQFCRESPHRMLGHLTACEISWLPLMRAIRNGEVKAKRQMHPNVLFIKQEFAWKSWRELLERFVSERAEWRRLLAEVDLDYELQTQTRVFTARTLTQKLIDHEARHFDDV